MENNIEIFCELYRLYGYAKGIISTIFFMRSLGKVKPYDGFFMGCAYPKIDNYPELESIIDSNISYMIDELKSTSSQINISTDPKYKYYKCMIMIKFYESTVQIEPQQRSNIIRNGKQQQQQQQQQLRGSSRSPDISNSETSLSTSAQIYKNNWETWNLNFNIIDRNIRYPMNRIFKDFTNYKSEFTKIIFQIVELSNENNKNLPKITDKDKVKDKICYFPFRIVYTLNSNITSVDSDDNNELGNSSSSSIEYVFKTGSGNLIVSNSDPSQRARISGGSSGATATSVKTTSVVKQAGRGSGGKGDKQSGNGGGYTGEEIIRNGLNFIKKTVLGDQ
ncbi:unnamed protein product [[Candida] boidinii]|nr:unnamed protein product [[Candida] boidinii]